MYSSGKDSISELIDMKPNVKSAQEMVASARVAFETGKTRSLQFRCQQLRQLVRMIEENTDAFIDAIKQDVGKSKSEVVSFDIEASVNDIKRILNNVKEWNKATYPLMTDELRIQHDPCGVVLVLGSWNYPLTLLLTPLGSAISGGNCVIVKPSEIACETAELISTLLPKYLDPDCFQVYLGGVEETKLLLEQKFDYIFFTGSTRVGRIIHAAANKYLTPVTLELGGKCPAYVDTTADMQIAVRRILWGKCTNVGQTCMAPDYILCSEEVKNNIVPIAKQVFKEWYGDDAKTSPSYSRIINKGSYNRLVSYLEDKSNIAIGGKIDPSHLFIEPTILTNVSPNNPVMIDEIFGPILPIVVVKNMNEAAAFINARDKPLSLYVFTNNGSVKEYFIKETSSGNVVINDTMLQYIAYTLPFGGVGLSGMGKYHAHDSFNTFVRAKSVIEKKCDLSHSLHIHRSYTPPKAKCLKQNLEWFKYLVLFSLGIIFVICLQIFYFKIINKS